MSDLIQQQLIVIHCYQCVVIYLFSKQYLHQIGVETFSDCFYYSILTGYWCLIVRWIKEPNTFNALFLLNSHRFNYYSDFGDSVILFTDNSFVVKPNLNSDRECLWTVHFCPSLRTAFHRVRCTCVLMCANFYR